MLSALEAYLDKSLEVFVVSPETGDEKETADLVASFRRAYLPNRVFVQVRQGAAPAKLAAVVPALEGKLALRGRATAFVCERGHCQLPTSDPLTFAKQLKKVEPLPGG